jgi:hypothetical protein
LLWPWELSSDQAGPGIDTIRQAFMIRSIGRSDAPVKDDMHRVEAKPLDM